MDSNFPKSELLGDFAKYSRGGKTKAIQTIVRVAKEIENQQSLGKKEREVCGWGC